MTIPETLSTALRELSESESAAAQKRAALKAHTETMTDLDEVLAKMGELEPRKFGALES